jgi:hypothetical protein
MKINKLKEINRNLKHNLDSIPNSIGRAKVMKHINLIDEFLNGKFKCNEDELDKDRINFNKWFSDMCIIYK